MKRRLTWLAIREMQKQSKPNKNYNEKPLFTYRSAKIKRLTIPNVVKDVEQVELSWTVFENTVVQPLWKSVC